MRYTRFILSILLVIYSCTAAAQPGRNSTVGDVNGVHTVRGKLRIVKPGYAITDTVGVDTTKISSKVYVQNNFRSNATADSARRVDSTNYYFSPVEEPIVYDGINNPVKYKQGIWYTDAAGVVTAGAKKILPANKDGYTYFRYFSDSYAGMSLDTVIDFATTSDYLFGVNTLTGTLYRWENGVSTSMGAATANYYRLRRTGITVYLESSNDAKAWTVIHTFGTTYAGRLYPHSVYSNSPSRGRLYYPVSYGLVSTGVVLGNSTIASYLGQPAVTDYIFSTDETNKGYQVTNLAVPGHTIQQQQTAWMNYANKKTAQWIIIAIGLNNLNYAVPTTTELAILQELVDSVYNTKAKSAKILIATMTPCRQRLIDVYGGVNGLVSYQKWVDMNNAIMGIGSNPIVRVDYRFNWHTNLLNDGNGNLQNIFEVHPTNDHVHQNAFARKIEGGDSWRQALTINAFLPNRPNYSDYINTYAVVDFANTAAGTYTDVTVTIIGASDNDMVQVTSPNAIASLNGTVTGFVSATNTITLRFRNLDATNAINPASATYKIRLSKIPF